MLLALASLILLLTLGLAALCKAPQTVDREPDTDTAEKVSAVATQTPVTLPDAEQSCTSVDTAAVAGPELTTDADAADAAAGTEPDADTADPAAASGTAAAEQIQAALTSPPETCSSAAVVIEAHSGELIFSANGDQPLPPASTGKILTALLALDLVDDLSAETTISPRAAAVEEMSIYLKAGEVISIAELLQGALVHSGNDACYALAEAITGGSEPLYVYWMNQKAAALGAASAHFVNTNGLPAEGHAISAYDLAMLTAYAMHNEFFARTVASKAVALGEGENSRFYKNTNKLLWQDAHIVGVKTGTTDAAGPCLVAAYADGAALYISVVFNSSNRYGESLELLRYAAGNYRLLWPVRKGQALAYWPDGSGGGSLLYAGGDLFFLLPENETQGLSLEWNLPHYVAVKDAAGAELGRVELVAKADAAGF